jgi:hypothetical protein
MITTQAISEPRPGVRGRSPCGERDSNLQPLFLSLGIVTEAGGVAVLRRALTASRGLECPIPAGANGPLVARPSDP